MILETIIALIFGLLIGSFLNVVVYRLPIGINHPDSKINLANPRRSFCPVCEQRLGALELIPIFSFLLQKGKCRRCSSAISWQYPLVELMAALTSAFVVFQFGITIAGGFYLLLAYFLIPLFVIDLKEQLLPNILTLPMMWIGFVYQMQFGELQEGVIGAMAGYLFLWSVYWGFKLITGKEGMGYGDFKLLAALGAWVGWQVLPMILLIASLLAIGVHLILRSDKNQPFAFGVFLIIACLPFVG